MAESSQVGDRDIDVRSVVKFGVALYLMAGAMFALMWGMSVLLKSSLVRHDVPLPPLAEARERRLPPEPRLQPKPNEDMRALRAREREVLTTYGWTSREQGLARIPVECAIDLLAERGLPTPNPASTPAAPSIMATPTAESR